MSILKETKLAYIAQVDRLSSHLLRLSHHSFRSWNLQLTYGYYYQYSGHCQHNWVYRSIAPFRNTTSGTIKDEAFKNNSYVTRDTKRKVEVRRPAGHFGRISDRCDPFQKKSSWGGEGARPQHRKRRIQIFPWRLLNGRPALPLAALGICNPSGSLHEGWRFTGPSKLQRHNCKEQGNFQERGLHCDIQDIGASANR